MLVLRYTHIEEKPERARSSSTLCGTNWLLQEIILKSFRDPFRGREGSAQI